MKGSKICVSNCLIIVKVFKTAIILALELLIMLKEACIYEFLIFVNINTNIDFKMGMRWGVFAEGYHPPTPPTLPGLPVVPPLILTN